MADIKVQYDGGSIALVIPKTREAREWVKEHVDDDALWLGRGLAVEPRYLDNLVKGMRADGLIVE